MGILIASPCMPFDSMEVISQWPARLLDGETDEATYARYVLYVLYVLYVMYSSYPSSVVRWRPPSGA